MNIKNLLSYSGFPVLAVIIIFLSLYPKLPEPPVAWDFFDKIEHIAAYMVLAAAGVLFFNIIIQKRSLQILLNAVICIFLGGIMELIQPLTGRHADFYDFLVNSIGVIAGILIVKIFYFVKNKIVN